MKKMILLLSTVIFAQNVFAAPLLERELFNSRNGETYVCKVHDNLNAELIHEGITVGKFPIQFQSSKENVLTWIGELKKQIKNNNLSMDEKIITQYVHRALKQYSFYANGKKVVYYSLRHYAPKKSKKADTNQSKKVFALGSIEHKANNDKGNVQRLRGQTDDACKKAMAKL